MKKISSILSAGLALMLLLGQYQPASAKALVSTPAVEANVAAQSGSYTRASGVDLPGTPACPSVALMYYLAAMSDQKAAPQPGEESYSLGTIFPANAESCLMFFSGTDFWFSLGDGQSAVIVPPYDPATQQKPAVEVWYGSPNGTVRVHARWVEWRYNILYGATDDIHTPCTFLAKLQKTESTAVAGNFNCPPPQSVVTCPTVAQVQSAFALPEAPKITVDPTSCVASVDFAGTPYNFAAIPQGWTMVTLVWDGQGMKPPLELRETGDTPGQVTWAFVYQVPDDAAICNFVTGLRASNEQISDGGRCPLE